jgi:CO/xanthine dehydrogenase Mo-binding subunit
MSIGESKLRADGPGKVSGSTLYAYDLEIQGMLQGRVLRSPHAAGRIKRLDVSVARGMPGVRAVATAADAPDSLAGWVLRDTPLFAREFIRYCGEPIAAVAAETLEQADAALAAIQLDIEPWEPVVDLDAAIAPGARVIHPDVKSYRPSHGTEFPRYGNVATESVLDRGDTAAIFATAALVVEDEFTANRQYQAYLEPKSAIAQFKDGRFIIWSGHQWPYNLRERMAQFFGGKPSDTKVIVQTSGGGFGGKLDYGAEPYAAILSKLSGGLPVKILIGRGEDMGNATSRENSVIRIRSALDASGTIIARELYALFDNGAYSAEMPFLVALGVHFAGGAYRVGKIKADCKLVYTNTTPTGAMRGVNGIAVFTAVERHMDNIARKLGEDRLAFRRRHAWRSGDAMPNAQVLTDANVLHEALDRVADLVGWDDLMKNRKPNRGYAISAGIWLVNPLPGSVTLKLEEDGTVNIMTGAIDCGTGSLAVAVPQIVASALSIPYESVRVIQQDTDVSGWDGGAQGSRTTQVIGLAAERAAAEIKDKLFHAVAGMLQAKPEDLELADGHVVVRANPLTRMTISEAATAATWTTGAIIASGSGALSAPPHDPSCASGLLFPALSDPTYHVHFAEVEVDPVTGNVSVVRYVVAQDIGKVINPATLYGQVQGGVTQGIGLSLYESLRLGADGRYVESSLEAYRLPLAIDIPRAEVIFLDNASKQGPGGGMKGAAEPPIVLGPSVIGNAIADALGGLGFNTTPITPEDILAVVMAQERASAA